MDRRLEWLLLQEAIARASPIETRDLRRAAPVSRALLETTEPQRVRALSDRHPFVTHWQSFVHRSSPNGKN